MKYGFKDETFLSVTYFCQPFLEGSLPFVSSFSVQVGIEENQVDVALQVVETSLSIGFSVPISFGIFYLRVSIEHCNM